MVFSFWYLLDRGKSGSFFIETARGNDGRTNRSSGRSERISFAKLTLTLTCLRLHMPSFAVADFPWPFSHRNVHEPSRFITFQHVMQQRSIPPEFCLRHSNDNGWKATVSRVTRRCGEFRSTQEKGLTKGTVCMLLNKPGIWSNHRLIEILPMKCLHGLCLWSIDKIYTLEVIVLAPPLEISRDKSGQDWAKPKQSIGLIKCFRLRKKSCELCQILDSSPI